MIVYYNGGKIHHTIYLGKLLSHRFSLTYCIIIATYVFSERVFSSAENIMSDNRNRLSDENLDMLIFL